MSVIDSIRSQLVPIHREGIPFIAGLGLLAFVIWQNRVGIGQALQRPLQIVPLGLAASIGLVAAVQTFVRWYVLVRAQDLPFTVTDSIRLGLGAGRFGHRSALPP